MITNSSENIKAYQVEEEDNRVTNQKRENSTESQGSESVVILDSSKSKSVSSDGSRDDALFENSNVEDSVDNTLDDETSTESGTTGSDEEEDEEEDGDDDDDEPPRLKYTRISKLPSRFFDKDPVSACCFNTSAFIFATHSGIIHLCKPDFTPIRTFKAHMASILSLDCDGEYFASGSMDGSVVIGSIENTNDTTRFDLKRPVYAVVLDKKYRSSKSFYTGGTGGELTRHNKGWLGQRDDTVLSKEQNGPITLIKVFEGLVLWTNDSGIHIIHAKSGKAALDVPIPSNFPNPAVFWPRIHIVDKSHVLLAWYNSIWQFKVTPEARSQASKILSSAASSFISASSGSSIEIEWEKSLDGIQVTGIAETGGDLIVLNYVPPRESDNSQSSRTNLIGQPSELELLQSYSLEEISVDVVAMHNYESLGFNDYHLYEYASNGEDPCWFLVSARDAIMVRKCSVQDKLEWYYMKKRYLEAWKVGSKLLGAEELLDIGLKQANKFASDDDWDSAASFLSTVLKLDLEHDPQPYIDRVFREWDSWIDLFFKSKHIKSIVDEIPSDASSQVPPQTYDNLLKYYLELGEYQKLADLVTKWDERLFDREKLVSLITEKLDRYDNEHPLPTIGSYKVTSDDEKLIPLRKMYVDLLQKLDEIQPCIPQLIRLQEKNVLNFINEHHILEQNVVILPMIFSALIGDKKISESNISDIRNTLDQSISILIANRHEVVPSRLIAVFSDAKMEYINYLYLESLGKEDKLLIKGLEDKIVELDAIYNKELLLDFLTRHENYSIEQAISVCEKYHCIRGWAYLLNKVGEKKKALTLIIDELDDPETAIQFAESANDKELWDFLLDYSMNKPDFITALLETVGELTDPIPVVSRIIEGVEIKGLKHSLINILNDVSTDEMIHQLILKIITNEASLVLDQSLRLRLKGYTYPQLSSHGRFQGEALIRLPEYADENKLIPEKEIVGEGKIDKQRSGSVLSKIQHARYISQFVRQFLQKKDT